MLLLLQGAGVFVVTPAGERAYANISYAATFAGAIVMSVVNTTDGSMSTTHGAAPGLTPTTSATDTLGLTTDAYPTEE